MAYNNSKTSDVLWGARKEILTSMSAIEVRLDQMDPTGEDRYEDDPEATGQLSFLMVILGQLKRANGAIREVEFRLSQEEYERYMESHA